MGRVKIILRSRGRMAGHRLTRDIIYEKMRVDSVKKVFLSSPVSPSDEDERIITTMESTGRFRIKGKTRWLVGSLCGPTNRDD